MHEVGRKSILLFHQARRPANEMRMDNRPHILTLRPHPLIGTRTAYLVMSVVDLLATFCSGVFVWPWQHDGRRREERAEIHSLHTTGNVAKGSLLYSLVISPRCLPL